MEPKDLPSYMTFCFFVTNALLRDMEVFFTFFTCIKWWYKIFIVVYKSSMYKSKSKLKMIYIELMFLNLTNKSKTPCRLYMF